MDLQHLRASDGTGEAVLAHVDATRIIGSTVLSLDNVDNWNTKCVVVTGTPNANGFIAAAGMTVMYGHITAGDFIIDGYAPGYSDNGNTTSEVAIVKMTTNWADTLISLLSVILQDNGKLKTTALDEFYKPSEQVFDHVSSGCVLTGTGYGSTLAWSLTSGVVYINGLRYTVAAATGSVTASKDTYFDILMPVSGNVATLVNTGGNIVNNNVASPALAANSIRIGIISSGANIASLASINQGQEDKVLPIVSSVPYSVVDGLGNLICPRDPQRRLLGYRQRLTSFGITGNTNDNQIPELSCPVKIPLGRKVEAILSAGGLYNSNATVNTSATIWRGTVGSGTQVGYCYGMQGGSSSTGCYAKGGPETPGTSATYNGALRTGNAGTTGTIESGGAGSPVRLAVYLV